MFQYYDNSGTGLSDIPRKPTVGKFYKRVLLLAPQPFYEDRGTPIAVRQVLLGLNQLGYEVDVVTYPIGQGLEIKGIKIFRGVNPLKLQRVQIGFSLRKIALDLGMLPIIYWLLRKQKYVCIHAVEEAAFFAVIFGRLFGIPVVYDMQSSLPEQLANQGLFRLLPLKTIIQHFEKWLLRHVDCVMCSAGLSERIRSVVPKVFIREWSFFSEYRQAISTEVDELRAELKIPAGAPIVLYTGTFEDYQGLPMLIDGIPAILSKIPNAVFVLVGNNCSKGRLLFCQARTLGVEKSIRFIPRQKRDHIPKYLALSDVLVSPRLYGGNLPLKIFDYLAAVKPIVATDIPTHRTLLNEERAVLVTPESQSFADGVLWVLENPFEAKSLAEASGAYTEQQLGWPRFFNDVEFVYSRVCNRSTYGDGMKSLSIKKISIIIPVYNAASLITKTIGLVRSQKPTDIEMEVLVIDDGSRDMTSTLAKSAGAKVIPVTGPRGNPARARNIGAKNASGDILIFLDVDCHPEKGWLSALLKMHAQGYLCVAGGLSMPDNLSLFARLDYYCGWYHVHPHRTAGTVLNCPPCNISIDRSLFLRTSGFTEQQPIAYSHEELCWQEELRVQEIPIYFEPQAAAAHWNRDGFGNLMRRNYRWAYGVIESKANNRTVRMAWLYQFPWMAILLALPLVPIQTFYIITCWLRAGIWEPLFLMPLVLAARTAYGFGMLIGGIQWICSRNKKTSKQRFPRWI